MTEQVEQAPEIAAAQRRVRAWMAAQADHWRSYHRHRRRYQIERMELAQSVARMDAHLEAGRQARVLYEARAEARWDARRKTDARTDP